MVFQLCNVTRKDPGTEFYDLAKVFARSADLANALRCLCNAFFFRNARCLSIDKDFYSFFEIQMTIYLLSRRSLNMSFCEGDMIYALIKEKWEDVKDYANLFSEPRRLYKMVRIDFPYDIECPEEAQVGQFFEKCV